MKLEYLKEFIVLTQTKNYFEAAERLFISQSSLSRHIQSMEVELGAPLFIRTSRKVDLSEIGREFLPYAEKIVDLEKKYNAKISKKLLDNKKIIVACLGALAPYDMGNILSKFKADNPDITLEFVQPREQPFNMLRNGQFDFLLTGENLIPEDEFNHIITHIDNYVAVVSSTHSFAKRKSVNIEDLANQKLALHNFLASSDSGFMDTFRHKLSKTEFIITDGTDMLDLAAVGGYVAIMTKKPALFFSDSSVSVVDIEPIINTKMAIAYRKLQPLSGSEQRFIEYISKVFCD